MPIELISLDARERDKRPWKWSLMLHGVVLLLLLLVALVDLIKFDEDPVVFEMVSFPLEPLPETESGGNQAATAVPSPEPAQPAPLPEMPEPDIQPVSLVSSDPPPTSAPEPRPEPEPRAAPPPEPQRVNYEDWARNRDLPDRIQRRPASPAVSRSSEAVEIPEIRVQPRLESGNLPPNAQPAEPRAVPGANAMESYVARLQQRLRAEFRPIGIGFVAEVSFTVTGDGRFENVRLVRASGDASFDRAVLAAFRTTQPPGPPPDGNNHTWKLVFRSVR